MSFHKLPDDVMSEIYSYDSTYKEKFCNIIEKAFNHIEFRVLKQFLEGRVIFPYIYLSHWLTIREFTFENRRYFEVTYFDSKFIFHVFAHQEKIRMFRALYWDKMSQFILSDVMKTKYGIKISEWETCIERLYEYNRKTFIVVGYLITSKTI